MRFRMAKIKELYDFCHFIVKVAIINLIKLK